MKDFNLVQYLRENKQGSFGMLNHYVDLKPLKEEDQEVPYAGPEDKLDGLGDDFDQAEAIPEVDADMKEEGEGFQSQHSDSADWERFYQEGWHAGYQVGWKDGKKAW
jgi:hypothetical protein